MFKALAFLVALAALAKASLGQAVYTSQDRWIGASDGAGWYIEKSAPDFEPFNESANVTYGYAEQDSTLEFWQIKAQGYVSGVQQNGWCGFGASNFSTTFDLTEPTSWTLTGKLTIAGESGKAAWTLTGPGVNIVVQHESSAQIPLTGSGVLGPGEYLLTAFCSSDCNSSIFGESSKFEFNWSLDLPCQADCDASGSLNIDDFICFQTYFVLGDLAADCDGDTVLTIDDFICFQTSFVLGC